VAWHILARADTFMRRSDLSFEVLTAMLFAACNAYNVSPRHYQWGQGSPYELWRLDRVSMLHFLFVPGTMVCFPGPSGTDCGLYLMPGDSGLHVVYELRSRSLTLVPAPSPTSSFLASALRSTQDPGDCFRYPAALHAAPALGIPVLVDSQLALAPARWLEARMLAFSCAASPSRTTWRVREDGGVACRVPWTDPPPLSPTADGSASLALEPLD
jgi:hypothetical protein